MCVLCVGGFETIPGGIRESFLFLLYLRDPFPLFPAIYCWNKPSLITSITSHHALGVHSIAANASGVFKSRSASQLYVVIGTEMTAMKI
jgi:hypothetical protein